MTSYGVLEGLRAVLLNAVETVDALLKQSRDGIEASGKIPYLYSFRTAAARYSVQVRLLASIAKHESRFIATARNNETAADARKGRDVNSLGLMQILYPDTAAAIANERSIKVPSEADLYDPTLNLDFGAYLVRQLLDRFPTRDSDGFPADAVAAYNAGKPRRLSPNGPYVNQAYVARVKQHWLEFEGVV